ncbi:MAG TPA: hypothetical protein VGK25_05620 [Ignavibacteria bacterium]
MNWKLIFQLSLFGLAMALATVFVIPSNIEPIVWFVIFVICAYFIAKKATGKYFLHGFMVSIFNSVWITVIHILFYSKYVAMHPDFLMTLSDMPLQGHPRLMMLLIGPVIGIIFGIILGLFSWIASKIFKKPAVQA